MQKDLGMSDEQWSAGISMFYVGYIISQIPGNVILAKGNPRILLPACMLAWSAVTICMAAMTSGWSFILCRFLVGLTEGPFVPAVSLMTSSWYTKQESPLRMCKFAHLHRRHSLNTDMLREQPSGTPETSSPTSFRVCLPLASWKT
jgi:MFS family permease